MTATELRRKVLEKLQVLASSEPVQAADGQLVQTAYAQLHEILFDGDLIPWTIAEEIPVDYAGPMVSLVAAELVDEFHCPSDLKVKLLVEGKFNASPTSMAERQIRKLSAPSYDGEPAQSEYF